MFKKLSLAVSAIALLSISYPALAEHIHSEGHDETAAPATEEAPATASEAASEATPAATDDVAPATEEAAPATTDETPAATASSEEAPAADAAVSGDIVATASSNPDFSTLVSAINAADLTTALQGEGPFTVFAPNNAAFSLLPPGMLEALLKPENKGELQDLLKYHIVAGKITSSDIKDGETELDTMLTGKKLRIVKTAEGITVNGAKVSAMDVPATNGVIYVIDKVVSYK
ncbi:MAG: fasciclin domain-containing protein [Alphaproteobacteria bacterium]|nr:fasciclin domain-containing protein [Alphaproteobacteria bacterium]